MITRNYPNGMILALGAAVLSLAVGTPAWIRVVPVLLVLVAMQAQPCILIVDINQASLRRRAIARHVGP